MTKSITINQPMFLPWAGMINQVILSDIFVYYDDVDFPNNSSFINRIQIKSPSGTIWLNIPIDKKRSEKKINATYISYVENWQKKHIETIYRFYKKTKYFKDLEELIEKIYSKKFITISDFNIYSFELILSYFNIKKDMFKSSELNILGTSSKRLLDICKYFNANIYITGHGARNYLKHDLFEENNIEVKYMNYKINQYNQNFEDFTPYVSILDLIANEGKDGIKFLKSTTTHWKIFLNEGNK